MDAPGATKAAVSVVASFGSLPTRNMHGSRLKRRLNFIQIARLIKYSGGRWDAWDARKGMATDAAKQQFVKVQCLPCCPFAVSLSLAAQDAQERVVRRPAAKVRYINHVQTARTRTYVVSQDLRNFILFRHIVPAMQLGC